MKLYIDDNFLVIEKATNEEKTSLKNRFTYKDASNAFRGGSFDKKKIKNVSFLKKEKKFLLLRVGFLKELIQFCKNERISIEEIEDRRTYFKHKEEKYSYEELKGFFNPDFDYVEHQIKALRSLIKAPNGLIKAVTGSGKCLGKGTGVLMYDGSIKNVENVKTGDILIGPDSKPRNVLSTNVGYGKLYKIKQKNGNDYIVNEDHILSLKVTGSVKINNNLIGSEIKNISVKDYLKTSNNFKHCTKGYKVPIDFQNENYYKYLNPYFLGLWLGDGRSSNATIINEDTEIINYLKEYCESNNFILKEYNYSNKTSEYAITNNYSRQGIRKEFKENNLFNNKHIPDKYKFSNSKNDRLELLAGLIDSDGCYDRGYFEIIQKNIDLANDIVFLARSLGFRVNIRDRVCSAYKGHSDIYKRISISGDCDKIPTKIKRKQSLKRMQKKDVLLCGIEIEYIGEGNYYGFELDGDKLFVLEDFTVTHNTEIIIALAKVTKLPTLILVDKISIAAQTQKRMQDNGLECGICYGKGVDLQYNMISTIQSVKKIPDLHKYKMLIIDEVHKAASKTYQDFLERTTYPLRYGFSATPEGNNEYRFALIRQFLGPILTEIGAKELIENKVISRPLIKFIESKGPNTLDWPSANDKCIINNDKRNKKIVDLALSKNEPTLILIRYIEHGETLNELIPNSVFVSGITSLEERQEVIEKFESGEIKYVISSNIFNEGISINAIKVLIIASGGKSKVETLQKLGRALRTDEGKYEAIVYDFNDKGNKFTKRHSDIRKSVYKKAGFDVIET